MTNDAHSAHSTRFAGRVAMVTGAASGIGRAVAERLARDGATVIIADRDTAGAEATAEAIRAAGGQASSHLLDVTSDDSWTTLMRQVAHSRKRLDIVVHAAGVACSGSVMEGSLAEWRETMAVNADGTLLAVRHALLAMRPAGRGSIVTMGSLYGTKPKPGMASDQFQFRIAVHVPKPFRRRGVATALVDHLAGHAREQQFRSLAVLLEPGDRDAALPFLGARGFQTVDRMTTVEARVERMAAWLFERRRWLIDRGEIPVTAEIVPLPEASIQPVAELHARSIGGVAPYLAASLTELARSPDGRDTVVLLIDGIVRGYHRVEIKGDLSTTHALAVTEDLRGGGAGSGWAGLFLLADRVEECTRRGVLRSRFSCLSTVRPTLRLATIFESDVVSIGEYLCRDLVR